MLALLLAASFTFTATSTGLEKGAPVEFYWVDKHSDRDYEALFILDDLTQSQFRAAIEKAGLKRGKAVNAPKSIIWPVGCPLTIEPKLESYVNVKLPEGFEKAPAIYTGGMDGTSIFALYSMNESAIVFNGNYPQGDVYNAYTVKQSMKKGEKVKFTISWNDADRPKSYAYTISTNNLVQVLKEMNANSSKGEIDVQIAFDENLSFHQAATIAKALQVIDSPKVKINGVKTGELYYKAFLPKVQWLSRKERLVQPFELTLGDAADKDQLIFIEEDWTVEGDDPKLTPKAISYSEAAKKEKTDTCFIFAARNTPLKRIYQAMLKLKGSHVVYWYVYERQ